MNERIFVAYFILGDLHHPALLVKSAGGNFGGMGIQRDGGEPFHRAHVAQVLSEAYLVDLESSSKGRITAGMTPWGT
ncbi:hypothetical protein EOA75_33235 [Mesorhizobium sp. M1A.F.Ca.IN.022.07.1.1]|nr:hypothetical protein EOA75_33235 [Mesorhizobium sp. M1A.F.Ca.IN.022.07.1.1]RWM64403.1 MAG: hypothetical protein EOR82_31755 [Mesorhizobium sp.]RWM88843.1 MAG: hypothetical protein EOR86_30115 [Mesorhizobium sp.]